MLDRNVQRVNAESSFSSTRLSAQHLDNMDMSRYEHEDIIHYYFKDTRHTLIQTQRRPDWQHVVSPLVYLNITHISIGLTI